MKKMRLAIVGLVAAAVIPGFTPAASAAEFNHGFWKECVKRGAVSLRWCCEHAGGTWEYRRVKYKGRWYQGWGCTPPSTKTTKAAGAGETRGGPESDVREQPDGRTSGRPEQAPSGGGYEQPWQHTPQDQGAPTPSLDVTFDEQDAQVRERPQRASQDQDQDEFESSRGPRKNR